MPTDNYSEKIKIFFAAYAQRFQDALKGEDNVEETANAFTDSFIEANPQGVSCGKNDEQFRKVISQGNKHYRQIGTKEMSVDKIESSRLDEHHYMAKVHWHSLYQKKDGTKVIIDFAVIYLLQEVGNSLKVFAYITGDEQGVLKEHGII